MATNEEKIEIIMSTGIDSSATKKQLCSIRNLVVLVSLCRNIMNISTAQTSAIIAQTDAKKPTTIVLVNFILYSLFLSSMNGLF
jgi:hypothetical protein